jgi:hypothetical protein
VIARDGWLKPLEWAGPGGSGSSGPWLKRLEFLKGLFDRCVHCAHQKDLGSHFPRLEVLCVLHYDVHDELDD